MPGMRRVLNRAYIALNDVLGLAGNENASLVDLSSVVLTHDMNPVVQAARVQRILFYHNATTLAGATDLLASQFQDTSDWVTIHRDKQSGAEGWNPAREDLIITSIGVDARGGNLSSVQILSSDGLSGSGTMYRAITNPLDSVLQAAAYSSLGEYYASQAMPWRVAESDAPVMRIADAGAAGNVTTNIAFRGLVAPKGILPRI